MALREFRLPDPGEGLTEAEIVTWRVAEGDTVAVNDIVVEVETAKSLVELPVPFAGRVARLLVAEGDTVEVGSPILAVEDDVTPAPPEPAEGSGEEAGEGSGEEAGEGSGEGSGVVGGTTSTGRTAVLVGYGVKQTDATRRPRRSAPAPAPEAYAVAAPDAAPAAPAAGPAPSTVAQPAASAPSAERVRALAKPPVRKLAKDLGVDLGAVTPTGEGGVVTRADVEAAGAAAGTAPGTAPEAAAAAGPTAYPSAGGLREERLPVKGVRKMTAQAMVASAFTAPHVTEWVQVDVTATMDLVERLRRDRDFDGVKVTPFTVVARALCLAVRRNPGVNATWDEAAQEIVLKHYVNLGVAAATPRGLVVPNVRDADRMDLRQLAEALGALTATAREGRTPPADMAGGTITITNVGVFGVDGGTPILNPGESAILAVGAVRRLPWVVTAADGSEAVVPRWVTTLALSFDHRLVDGELGSRFLADVAALLADPARALVWG
ncbi:MAG TPA: dihydrolipoamide acetyltransferase family protein [Dermatophilaceae bacterium]|nr:dihydrolipoamide acetyltransferase family protein [Dermatophilaceae bacterium]